MTNVTELPYRATRANRSNDDRDIRIAFLAHVTLIGEMIDDDDHKFFTLFRPCSLVANPQGANFFPMFELTEGAEFDVKYDDTFFGSPRIASKSLRDAYIARFMPPDDPEVQPLAPGVMADFELTTSPSN